MPLPKSYSLAASERAEDVGACAQGSFKPHQILKS